jgi:hypothetical protein
VNWATVSYQRIPWRDGLSCVSEHSTSDME